MKPALRLVIPAVVAIASLAPAGTALADAPSIDWPTEGAAVNAAYLTYNLPEDATPGSVKLVFTGAASTTLVLANSGAATPTLKLNTANLLTSVGVSSITGDTTLPDGAYSVTLEYEDLLAGAPHSSSARAFTLDRVTLSTMTMSLNNSQAVATNPLSFDFTLPEAALPGSVKVFFHPVDGGSGNRTVFMDTFGVAAGRVLINLDHPDWGTGVLRATPAGAITPGEYEISLSYQDALGNDPAQKKVTAILLGRWSARSRIGLVRPAGGKLKMRRGKGTVALTLNGPGSVNLIAKSSKGKALGTCQATLAAAGRKVCALSLNAAGRRALAQAGKAGLRVTLRASGSVVSRPVATAALPVKLFG